MRTTNIAIIGAGAISGIYLKNLTHVFKEVTVIGIYDLITEKAAIAQKEYALEKLYSSIDDILEDSEVDIILNLTSIPHHYDVVKKALHAGKHVYSEKPLGLDISQVTELVALAQAKKLVLAGAPDTFLGATIQTCRKIIDSKLIGDVVGCHCSMMCSGFEAFADNPATLYDSNGGPLRELGPYYITALVQLLGKITGVNAMSKKTRTERIATSEHHYGEILSVEVPTYYTSLLEFANGALGTMTITFDVHDTKYARFEIYGTEGTLIVPDPNFFNGTIQLYRPEDGCYKEMPLLFDYKENSRGLGVADMAKAIQTGRSCRANAQQLLHVMDVLYALNTSANTKSYIEIKTPYERTEPMKHLTHGYLD